ncbi:MAG TPA: glycosyltransferase family 1 protein [Bacteroidales bacterium]|nr:glycosyltransferase family 1 protein [Bacteroidales bacterium]
MKILFDHQIFAIQEFGGISRYFLELMPWLKKIDGGHITTELTGRYSNNVYLDDFGFIQYRNFFRKQNFPGKGPLLNQINKLYSIPIIRKGGFDVLHPTYYDPYFLRFLGKKPFVLTIYDMIHELYPQFFPRYDSVRKNKSILVNKADAIIAISENTKKDLVRIYKLDPEKVHVIYLGNPFQDREPIHKRIEIPIPDKYILFVGNRSNYKNYYFFIKAVRPLFAEYPDLSVVCAGGGKFSREEYAFLKESGIQGKVVQITSNDEALQRIYHDAQSFIFPSLYEGFGLPVLEAFSCHCPALLSNRSSLPEVGGNAALYFDPNDGESIRSAVRCVLDNEESRERLIEEGLRQLKKFRWEKTAEETRSVYQTVCRQ